MSELEQIIDEMRCYGDRDQIGTHIVLHWAGRLARLPPQQPAKDEAVGDALLRLKAQLLRAGASVPAPQATGTIEGAMNGGLCIALALVEGEILNAEEKLSAKPEQG